ncbi:MAG: nucleoside-diphosphate kinase [Patescibacteria group bacterium]
MKFDKQQTFLLIKPDGVQRSLVGDMVKRIERTGLKIVAMKMVLPTREQLIAHYNKSDEWFLQKGTKIVQGRKDNGQSVDKEPIEYGRDIIEQLVTFMSSGPCVAIVIQGNQAVNVIKKIVGGTEPSTSDVGTIRGDFTIDSYEHAGVQERAVRNLAHCSDVPEEAMREIKVWFKPDEIINYRLVQEQILYDVNLDGILE